MDEGAAHSVGLLLATAKLAGTMFAARAEAHTVQGFLNTGGAIATGRLPKGAAEDRHFLRESCAGGD